VRVDFFFVIGSVTAMELGRRSRLAGYTAPSKVRNITADQLTLDIADAEAAGPWRGSAAHLCPTRAPPPGWPSTLLDVLSIVVGLLPRWTILWLMRTSLLKIPCCEWIEGGETR